MAAKIQAYVKLWKTSEIQDATEEKQQPLSFLSVCLWAKDNIRAVLKKKNHTIKYKCEASLSDWNGFNKIPQHFVQSVKNCKDFYLAGKMSLQSVRQAKSRTVTPAQYSLETSHLSRLDSDSLRLSPSHQRAVRGGGADLTIRSEWNGKMILNYILIYSND